MAQALVERIMSFSDCDLKYMIAILNRQRGL